MHRWFSRKTDQPHVDPWALANSPCVAIHEHTRGCSKMPAGAEDPSATWPLPKATLDFLAAAPNLDPRDEFDAYLDALDFRDQLDVLTGQATRHVLAAERDVDGHQHPSRHRLFTLLRGQALEAGHIARAAAEDARSLTDQLTAWRRAHGITDPQPDTQPDTTAPSTNPTGA